MAKLSLNHEAKPAEALASPLSSSLNLFQVAWKHKSLIILCLILGTFMAVLDYSQRIVIYQSSAQVLITRKRTEAIPIAGSMDRGSSSANDDYSSYQKDIISSQKIISLAVSKFELANLASFQGRGDPTGAVMGSLQVSAPPSNSSNNGSTILTISCRSTVSTDCPLIINAVVKTYEAFLEDRYQSGHQKIVDKINETMTILSKIIKQLREDRKKLRDGDKSFPIRLVNGNLPEQERLATIDARISKLTLENNQLLSQIKEIQTAIAEKRDPSSLLTLPRAVDDVAKQTPNAKSTADLEGLLFPLVLTEAELAKTVADNHPDLKLIRTKMALIRERIAELAKMDPEPKPVSRTKAGVTPEAYIESSRRK